MSRRQQAPRPSAPRPTSPSSGEANAKANPAPCRFTHAGAPEPLDRLLKQALGGESWNRVRKWIELGKVRVDTAVVTLATERVRAGQEVEFVPNARRANEPRLADEAVVYVDTHLIVVHKPAGISSVPFENERGTLDELVDRWLSTREGARRGSLSVVHRLDKETSGLLVFARTLSALRGLKNQFRFHTVERRYWAVAHGAVRAATFSSRLVQDRGDGLRGSTNNPRLGQEATTHVRPLTPLPDATLVECKLETGRTHQIRIHLAEAGHPIVGERVYSKNYRGTLLTAPRILLHAFELGFEHPATGRQLHFETRLPDDMSLWLEQRQR